MTNPIGIGTAVNTYGKETYYLVDPLVLDLNGDGVKLTDYAGNPVLFDADHDGKSWNDANNNGVVDDGETSDVAAKGVRNAYRGDKSKKFKYNQCYLIVFKCLTQYLKILAQKNAG